MNRLVVDEAEAEERVFVEAITNQYESREAVKYLGAALLGFPCWCWFSLMGRRQWFALRRAAAGWGGGERQRRQRCVR